MAIECVTARRMYVARLPQRLKEFDKMTSFVYFFADNEQDSNGIKHSTKLIYYAKI